MTLAYRRHSGTSPNWNRATAFPSRITPHPILSPSFNQRKLPISPASTSTSTSNSNSTSTSTSNASSNPITLHSDQIRLYQSTGRAMRSPSIPTVSEDPREALESSSIEEMPPQSKTDPTQDQPLLAAACKGKDREVVRTRPIFHANLEEAKKFHQSQRSIKPGPRSATPTPKSPVSCEEVIYRYCDHFHFQLPVLELDRNPTTTTTTTAAAPHGGTKRVLLRIKRRLVGIGEGPTSFLAVLAAYNDAVLYLFHDPKLHNKLLLPNELVQWHHTPLLKN